MKHRNHDSMKILITRADSISRALLTGKITGKENRDRAQDEIEILSNALHVLGDTRKQTIILDTNYCQFN